MKKMVEIDGLVKSRKIDEALGELERILAEKPEDAEARMLFGVCQQMKGETESFCEVYRELAPQLSAREAAGEVSPVVSRWRQYCKVAAYLISLGIVTLVGGNIQIACAEDEPSSAVEQVKFSIKQEFQKPEFAPLLAGTTNLVKVSLGGSNVLVVARGEVKERSDSFNGRSSVLQDMKDDLSEKAYRNACANLFKYVKLSFPDYRVSGKDPKVLNKKMRQLEFAVRLGRDTEHVKLAREEVVTFDGELTAVAYVYAAYNEENLED